MDIFPILHFNYTPPAGVSAENKMSFSVLNASLSMGGYQSNTAGITNETKISAISINMEFGAGLYIGYDNQFNCYNQAWLSNPAATYEKLWAKDLDRLQKPQISNMTASSKLGVSCNYATDYVNKNAVICTYGRDLTIENTAPKMSRGNIIMSIIGAANMALSTAVVSYAFATSIVQNIKMSEMNSDFAAPEPETSGSVSSSQTRSLKVIIPQTMYFLPSGGTRPAYRIKSLNMDDVRATVYRISAGTAPAGGCFSYAEDVTFALLETTMKLEVEINGTVYSGETPISVQTSQKENMPVLEDLTYLRRNRHFTLHSPSGESLDGSLPYQLLAGGTTLTLRQYSDTLNGLIDEMSDECAREKDFRGLKFINAPGTDGSGFTDSFRLKISSASGVQLAAGKSGNIQLPGYRTCTVNGRNFAVLHGCQTDPEDSQNPFVLREIARGRPFSGTDKRNETFLQLYNTANRPLTGGSASNQATAAEEFRFNFSHGVENSSADGMHYGICTPAKVELKCSDDTGKYTLTVTLDEPEDGEECTVELNEFKTVTYKKSVGSKGGHMVVSRSKELSYPSAVYTAATLDHLLDRTFALFANNASNQVSVTGSMKYLYFFFTLFYDEAEDQLIFRELPVLDYTSFYEALSSYGSDNPDSGNLKARSTIPVTAALGTAVAAPAALLASLGLAEIIQNCISSGINYTAKKKGIIFQVLARGDRKLSIHSGTGDAQKNRVELSSQGGDQTNSAVKMVADQLKLSVKGSSKSSITASSGKTVLQCGESSVTVSSSGFEIKSGQTVMTLGTSGFDVSFNGITRMSMNADTAKFNDQNQEQQVLQA